MTITHFHCSSHLYLPPDSHAATVHSTDCNYFYKKCEIIRAVRIAVLPCTHGVVVLILGGIYKSLSLLKRGA